jgi:hypothetical protein
VGLIVEGCGAYRGWMCGFIRAGCGVYSGGLWGL